MWYISFRYIWLYEGLSGAKQTYFFKAYVLNKLCVKEQVSVTIYFFVINWKINALYSTKITAWNP